MSRLTKKLLLIPIFMALVFCGREKASAQVITNGSFETGDYTGWTLTKTANGNTYGTWAILQNGETVNQYQELYDFCDKQQVVQFGSYLPMTFQASDGNYLAAELQNYGHDASMSQDITLPANATTMSWEMFYHNYAGQFLSNQCLAIYIKDLNNNILDTIFITGPDSPLSVPMTTYSADISRFAGQTVRLDVELSVWVNYFPVAFDNFRVQTQTATAATIVPATLPPGWGTGKKKGWEGPVPAGLEENKIPAGFDKGNKKGWNK